ncbi:hypothetical protein PAN70_059 [Pseudomonas phage PAN70]|nr:hypothetical protein PAN70_059 [Pseudomonas phage PAN70]
MSNVQPMAPRKVMTRLEREFLKVAGQELAQVKVGGAAALAALLVMIANWHGDRGTLAFTTMAGSGCWTAMRRALLRKRCCVICSA